MQLAGNVQLGLFGGGLFFSREKNIRKNCPVYSCPDSQEGYYKSLRVAVVIWDTRSTHRHTTQPGHPFVDRRNEYQPNRGDVLRLGSKGRYGMVRVWVTGKTV